MEQQKEGIRQEFMLLNWYLKEHLASGVRIAAFIGVFSLLCFLRNVPQDVTVYMIVLIAGGRASGAGLPADHRILRAAVSGRTD